MYAHENWASINTHSLPQRTSITSHTRPHAPTKLWVPNCKVESHVSGNFGRPHTCMVAHKVCGQPHDCVDTRCKTSLGVHEILWVLTYTSGRPREFMGDHTFAWMPKVPSSLDAHATYMDAQRRQSLGCPIMWPTSRILDVHYVMAGVPRHLRWIPTKLFGRPRNVMDAQTNTVLDVHEILWSSTKICGLAHTIVGTQQASVLGAQHHETWTANMCLLVPTPLLWTCITHFMGTQGICVDFHAVKWATIVSDMGVHHASIGRSRNVRGRPLKICGASRI